ncbi:MAG: hypothetical protein ABL904_14600, partial [Hyphomicrobiaceae bacterium]
VPARGPIDTIAAKYVAAMLTVTTRHECSAITQASGLMGFAAARAETFQGSLDALILSTIGGIDRQHLRLLERRARNDFPNARLIVCDWASPTSAKETSSGAGAYGQAEQPIATSTKLAEATELLAYARRPVSTSAALSADNRSTAPNEPITVIT